MASDGQSLLLGQDVAVSGSLGLFIPEKGRVIGREKGMVVGWMRKDRVDG